MNDDINSHQSCDEEIRHGKIARNHMRYKAEV